MPKWISSDGGGIDVPDEGKTPYGRCALCKAALYLESDGQSSHIKCPNGHRFQQIYNWGGYNEACKTCGKPEAAHTMFGQDGPDGEEYSYMDSDGHHYEKMT
jgi:hypothetical protein